MPSYVYYEEDVYVAQFLDKNTSVWRSYPDAKLGMDKDRLRGDNGDTVVYPWGEEQLERAVACVVSLRSRGSIVRNVRILSRRTNTVAWENGAFTPETWETVVSVTLTPQEEQMSDVDQPLLIPRTTLIETLEARLTEEQGKRTEADAKAAARRQTVLDAVSKLSTDQVTNLLSHHIWGDPDALVKAVDGIVEDGKFVTKALEATSTENSIEKYVRVLQLATNENIEVTPRDPVYPLL